MKNLEISKVFRDIAKILEIKGGNVFRIRAYERAAQNIEGLSQDLEDLIKEDRLGEIPGIGKDLSQRIKEFAITGKIKIYEDLKKSLPEGLLELLNIPSVGPKTARLLHEKLKVKNVADLEKAIKKGRLADLFGIKEKTIENISKGIAILKKGKERMNLAQAILTAEDFIRPLKKLAEVKNISPAGSLRRRKETIRDIDILVISDKPHKVIDTFVRLPAVGEILVKGPTKSSLRTKDNVQVDCRLVEAKSFGAALLYFTGSKAFNIKLRMIAQRKNLKINEYGVFRNNRYIAGRSEEEIFKLLGMPYIEPELREDNGEVELAQKYALPDLVKMKDIKGDFHMHSDWSDGGNSIEEMALACKQRGYSYAALTDHSQSLRIAGGLSIADLRKKKKEVEKINKKMKNFRILFATEVEIDKDGAIDYKDEILKDFDLVVAAIHSGFKQTKERLTNRIVSACRNKYVHIIAHPTGRLWGVRQAYDLDFDQIFKAAKETNTHFEINSFPDRLDLNDLNCRRAKEQGVKLAIGTDAHSIQQLEAMEFGVSLARRGWLEPDDVINTLSTDVMLKELKK